jgi:para-nitrobenzyl esterase
MSNKEAIAETRAGKVEGSYQDGLYIFKGIPYATPPVGELRWLPPQPVKPWEGVRPAQDFGTIAPQNLMAGGVMEGLREEEPQGEDCLFLNIWTPGLDDVRRPVMVWIHGGAFNLGSGSSPMYDGSCLAARGDAVVVTINYRLGVLGFLRLIEVTGGKIPATGNEGLLDQVAALKWVRDNITAFGGDSGNVTVFGESAGGMSIGCLLTMPSARGLFHKAILQSGVGSVAMPVNEAVTVAGQFLAELDISGEDIEALRALKIKRILDTDMKLRAKMAAPGEQMRITVTSPVVDGEILPEVPIEAIRGGSAKDIPVIAGTCLEEWKLFAAMQPGLARLSEAEMTKRLEFFIPSEHLPGLVEAYRRAREKRDAANSPVELLSAIQTDIMFRMPVIQFIEAQRDSQQLAYNYLFTWVSPVMGGILGSCHILDVGFVFGNYDDTFCGSGPDADKLSRCIQDAWLAFARTGDPSCESIGNWPPYGDNRRTIVLGRDCHIEEAPYEDERRAWDIMPNIFNVLL